MGRRRRRETRVGINKLGDVDRSMLRADSDGEQQTKVMRKRESSGQGDKARKRRKLEGKNCKLLSPNSVQVMEHVLEKGSDASLQVDQNCLSSRNSLDIIGINSAVKDNSFLTNPTVEENDALLSGNTVGIMNQRDLSQSLEPNHKHVEVYSRRSRKSGQRGKKNPHNSSDWTLWENGFHNKNLSTEESTQTDFGRKKNGDASSGVGSLAIDGKQDGYSKEKTRADLASKVSTDTNSNFNEVTTIDSETKGKTKRRGKKKKKNAETYIHDNLKPVSEKSVNMSVKSEKNGLEMGDLNSEILTKSEMRYKDNISQTRSVEEESTSLQRRSTVDAANKSVPPHPLELNLKTSKSKLKYTRRKKKNETSICSNQVLISEKEGSGSMKSEITDSVDRVDLYPEICSNSEKETAKPHLEKVQARKRDGAKKKVRTINEDNGLNNDELCHVSPVLAECKNGTLSQLQKYGTFTEEKSSNKDKEMSHCSLVKNVTDDATIIGNLTLDNMPVKLQRTSISCFERKLLILDLNGLLVDVVNEYRNFRAPLRVAGKSVFKRPFCDEFLEFCLERFNVGIWSSRKKENMNAIVNFLFGEKRSQLLFCWSQSQCTLTGFKTIENAHKPLVLKELKRLWNKEDHNLPWEKGDYLPSNTLLIDDSPYKALCNPPHTAIFPSPYSRRSVDDNSLGLEGDLRVYLRGIAMADDVQSYIKEHPFGQKAIMPGNPSWGFYLQIIERMNPSFTY